MTNEIKKWISKDGIEFLSKIGIKRGFIVVDFGSGCGHYAIPAAKIVSTEGNVYVIEKDKNSLKQLMQTAEEEGLSNIIIPINPEKGDSPKIKINNETVDYALVYDVLHYLLENERKEIYREIHRILKNGGILSVYPKHNKNDWPLWNLADMDLEDIIKEITEMKLIFNGKENVELFHDEGYDRGFILEFKKK
ncbi:MAG: class I SAM-dependent methyltransferase [Promethearchaeota archaeon]